MIRKVEHIGIAVRSLEQARSLYESVLGMDVQDVDELPERGVRVAMVDGQNLTIELLEPLGEDSPVARFIEKRGEGIHHIAFLVESIDDAVEQLKRKGVRFTTSKVVEGAHGKRVIFISPASVNGVLMELCENSGSSIV